jgi:N-acetylglutamate synthase-like GNAT family acetyltransferase
LVRQASRSDLELVRRLVSSSGLSVEGIDGLIEDFVVMLDPGRVVHSGQVHLPAVRDLHEAGPLSASEAFVTGPS